MSDTVHITVTESPLKGKHFTFQEHDTFLFGCLDGCHCRVPDDQQVSQLLDLHKSYRVYSICAWS